MGTEVLPPSLQEAGRPWPTHCTVFPGLLWLEVTMDAGREVTGWEEGEKEMGEGQRQPTAVTRETQLSWAGAGLPGLLTTQGQVSGVPRRWERGEMH